MKGRIRKEKKVAVSALEKEKKNPQPVRSLVAPPTVKEKIGEEVLKDTPAIQDLNLKVNALGEVVSGSLNEVATKFQNYDKQIKDTDEKITALGQAIGILNDEFSKLVDTLQTRLAIAPDNTPPGTTIVGSKRVEIEKTVLPTEPAPVSTQDKLFSWANLLAQLAGIGGGGGGGSESGGGSHTLGTTDLLKLILELQNSAEDRALKRQEVAISSMVNVVKLVMGKKVSPLEAEPALPGGGSHLKG